MKICYLADVNNYHTKKWCNYFLEQGHEVMVISLSEGYIDGCKTYSFKFSKVKELKTIQKLKYLFVVQKIRNILQKEKPDILHSHYASSYGLLGTLSGYHPHFISLWGSDVYIFPKKSLVHKYIIKKALNKKNIILSTSYCMAREASIYTKNPITITPFGVDINLFTPISYEENKNNFIIGINKSLEKIYGIDVLLKAFSIFIKRNKGINAELKIAGKGSQLENLISLTRKLGIENNVEFCGFLSESEMVKFIQNLDLAVFPSYSESFGVSAIEAQACGIPVIASNIEGFRESTNPQKSSYLFEKGNEQDLFKLIDMLYKNRKLRKEMGSKGRKFVEENFNIVDNFSKVNDLYSYSLN